MPRIDEHFQNDTKYLDDSFPGGLYYVDEGLEVALEALQSPARRGPIARKLRDFAEVTEEIRQVLQQGIDSCF